MSATVPLTVAPQATGFIEQMNLHVAFQKLLDHIPLRIAGVTSIEVSLQEPFDLGGGPRVIFDVQRTRPTCDFDDTEWNWQRWVADNFPPQEAEHFCLLSKYEPTDAG